MKKTTFATFPDFMDLNKLTVYAIEEKGHQLINVSISATKIVYRQKEREVKTSENSFYTTTEHVKRLAATVFEIKDELEFNLIKSELRKAFPPGFDNFKINSFKTFVEVNNYLYWLTWKRVNDMKAGIEKIILRKIEKAANRNLTPREYFFNKEPDFDIDRRYGKIIGDMQFEGCRYISGKVEKGFLCD